MSLLDTFYKIYKVEKKYGLLWTIPLFLLGCGTVFTCLYDQGLLPNLNEITKNCINALSNSAQTTGNLPLNELWSTISQPFFNVLPFMLIGAGAAGIPSWTVFGASDLARNAWDTAKIEYDRRKTISNNPELDRDKVNTKDREKYLSYNNELLRLYAGPDKKDRLIVPDGIESIGPDAFDRFVTEKDSDMGPRIRKDFKSIVLPSSIRSLNPANIPRNSTLELIDVTQKICLDRVRSDLKSKNICVQGGLFVDLLTACEVPYQGLPPNIQVWNLPDALIGRLKNTLIPVKSQESKKDVLDELHSKTPLVSAETPLALPRGGADIRIIR